jgi:hypothetical protein
VSASAIRVCCLLWAAEGQSSALHAYEDAVLALVPQHGGLLVDRELADGADGTPHEVQVFVFPDQVALDEYLADPARTARSDERDRVVSRTELFPVRVPRTDGAGVSTEPGAPPRL